MAFFVPNYLNIIDESELLSIIQEVQFENPKIKEIEKKIRTLRNKYINKSISVSKINTDPIVAEISTLFEQAFGFYSFQFSVDQSQIPNAYTMPLSSKIDSWNYKKCVKRTNEGLQFIPIAKVNIVAIITNKLLLDRNFSDREILAILLHEIGHNFSDSINNTLGIFSNFKKILCIPLIFIQPHNVSNKARGIATKITKYMRNNHSSMVDTYNAVKLFLGYADYVTITLNRAASLLPHLAVSNFINMLNNTIKQAVKNPVMFLTNVIFNFFGKEDEYTSDSFVAMYGYGTDLSSALIKIERHNLTPVDTILKESKSGAIYLSVLVESTDFVNMLLSDNHPATANRLLNILDTLEKEYNKDYINPKFKKETKKEIEEIKQLIKEEMENRSFDGNQWRVKWNKFILSKKKTKGPKDKMIEELLDKIGDLDD